MREVYPNIYLITEVSKFIKWKDATNIYIIAGSDGIIFEGGYGNRRIIKKVIRDITEVKSEFELNKKEFNITRALPSHAHSDHISGLIKLRKRIGFKIILTKQMAEITQNKKNFLKAFRADGYKDYFIINKGFKNRVLSFIESGFSHVLWNYLNGLSFIKEPDVLIEKNTEININGEIWSVFPSPGHSFDAISLYNKETGVLFSGDNLFKSMSGWLGPPESNLDDYIKTLEFYLRLPKLDLILPTHGEPIENPKERILEIIEHRRKRIQQVIDAVNEESEEGISPMGVIKKIYTNGNRIINQIARGWVCLSLKKLEEEGAIIRKETKREILFFPKSKI